MGYKNSLLIGIVVPEEGYWLEFGVLYQVYIFVILASTVLKVGMWVSSVIRLWGYIVRAFKR